MNDDLQEILDCMTGADGGINFVKLKSFLDLIKHDESEAARLIRESVRLLAEVIRSV